MQIEQLRQYLDHPADAAEWLGPWQLDDPSHGHGNLVRMATAGMTLDLLAVVCKQLDEQLPRLSDPDRALNNLDRFVAAARNPLSLGTLFERDRQALPILLQIFSTSQYLSDLIIADTESYDLLRMTEGQSVRPQMLIDELLAEIRTLADEPAVMAALRRFKRRETLRIGYGDIIRGQRLETVARQISYLADAVLQGAISAARRNLESKRGIPRGPDGKRARFVALALGKLGGVELNYSSDIDLIFLYDTDGTTDGARSMSNAEFFQRLARDVVHLLTEPTTLGIAYRVDLRLRPAGQQGAMAIGLEAALHYYDLQGRTWERQALVKARPAAGDLELGHELLARLEPWVYGRYLSRTDISGIKALKRRIEQRTHREGADERNVKTGHGGIRDVEFVIQFLQLLNGGDLPQLHTGNTLAAIDQLEKAGCLTHQERNFLDEHYAFLRKIEHRLQIMFDLQTHTMPESRDELRRLAIRMGYTNRPRRGALEAFLADYRLKTAINRRMLDHLLHDAFRDDDQPEPEVDLVLDPHPPPERVAEVLGRYPFRDVAAAHRNLMSLAEEKIRFLSSRRCRHFLAAIAPALLKAVAATPDPDLTLVNLCKVSDSLGGKEVLWELFSFNPPSLRLCVELCASSSFLSGLLISNPGMLDDLMDGLVLDKLPTLESLEENLAELARGAEDLEPILHSFKNAQQLRVGVRDILGKEDIHATTAALADIAQACLRRITLAEYARLVERFGEPLVAAEGEPARPSEFIILALGKFGGREVNYHSDLDLNLLYEADGMTRPAQPGGRCETTSNKHFFSELGQRIIKACCQLGPHGLLYQIDVRLRPTGKSGPLATSLDELCRYFAEGRGQLWERQALCKGRVVFGSAAAAAKTLQVIAECAYDIPWSAADAVEIRKMRRRLEETAGPVNIKRGKGGIVDIEFVVQMLQLKHGRDIPAIRVPGTRDALVALHQAGLLGDDDFRFFAASYQTLRTIEGRLRLMNTLARDELPDNLLELTCLARLMKYPNAEQLLADWRELCAENRRRFERIFAAG